MKPVTIDQGADITLQVKGQDGIEVSFRIKRSTPLKKLLNIYCFQRSVKPNRVTFLFDGHLFGREQTPDELEMEEGDNIHAFFHRNQEQRVCFDEKIAKDMAREDKEEAFLLNKFKTVLWRIVSKLIAENGCLKEEVTKLRHDHEEKDAALLRIGRITREIIRENDAPRAELKKELAKLKDEIKDNDPKQELTRLLQEIEEDDAQAYEEDDDDFIESGRFVSGLVEWAKKNQDFLKCKLSKL
ncbi:hypothetical protein QVD17_35291 [Tagetes erecta]|uniref:Ubiquitin-like domain-containing protein n=1 Tax=Tagetes erecta TaxID=13708 RepID=A0AAD8K393_TARER|nr:hypothetical protein QVD17_35291 [Tagetes erecta]